MQRLQKSLEDDDGQATDVRKDEPVCATLEQNLVDVEMM